MPPRSPLDGAAVPTLSPAEIAGAAHLVIVARCPIARLAPATRAAGVYADPIPDVPGHKRVQVVTDDGRLLADCPIPDYLVDARWLAGVDATRVRKSAAIAATCAACPASQSCRNAPPPALARLSRGPLTLLA